MAMSFFVSKSNVVNVAENSTNFIFPLEFK